jgi:hypothetical protein
VRDLELLGDDHRVAEQVEGPDGEAGGKSRLGYQ